MKKLILNKETIRNLSNLEMQNAMGGGPYTDGCTGTCNLICETMACPLPSHPGKCPSFAVGKVCQTGSAIACC